LVDYVVDAVILVPDGVEAARSGEDREAPAGHVAIAQSTGAGHVGGRRPGDALVVGAAEDDVVVAGAFVGGLGPDGHEGAVGSIEDEEVLVAGVAGGVAGDVGGEDDVVRVGAVKLLLEFFAGHW